MAAARAIGLCMRMMRGGGGVLGRTVGALALCLTIAGCVYSTQETERRVEITRGVGETRVYPFGGSPLRWTDSHVVVFLALAATATVDLDRGTVTTETDPTLSPSNPRPERVGVKTLPPAARYGPWTVKGNGRTLTADNSGDVTCGSILVSPDGQYVACSYAVVDRMAESRETRAAVIRLR